MTCGWPLCKPCAGATVTAITGTSDGALGPSKRVAGAQRSECESFCLQQRSGTSGVVGHWGFGVAEPGCSCTVQVHC